MFYGAKAAQSRFVNQGNVGSKGIAICNWDKGNSTIETCVRCLTYFSSLTKTLQLDVAVPI